jgi:protein-tyrosine phosphatase
MKSIKMKSFISIVMVLTLGVLTNSCMQNAEQKNAEHEKQLKPGHSLGIASVPNLRDVGGYTTKDGKTVARGIAYRSNQLNPVSGDDMKKIAELGLKNDYDLRTKAEVKERPDQIPDGVQYTLLNVLADADQAGPAMLEKLMHNPKEANEKLGGGKVDSLFIKGYREFISLPSAKTAYRELFLSLGDPAKTPALFHCTTGKDRTGWGSAALLTLLGVPQDVVMQDFLKSNEYILPLYRKQIDAFAAAGGDSLIPLAIFGVKAEYLNASFEEMQNRYGSIENYFSEGLGIDEKQQKKIKEHFLGN